MQIHEMVVGLGEGFRRQSSLLPHAWRIWEALKDPLSVTSSLVIKVARATTPVY